MVYKSKKAISPVVATALLLVVAVVAVVGFQTWFNNYQSGLNSKVEQESAAGSSITVERFQNGSVFIKNTATSDISATAIKITDALNGTTRCTQATGTLTKETVTTVSLTGCTAVTVGRAYNVVVVTSDGVFSGKVLAR